MKIINERHLKLALSFPRFKYKSGDPPIGLGYLASYARENSNAEVRIIDSTFENKAETLSRIEEFSPDILGIYSDTLMFKDAVEIAEYAKNKGIFVVAGGPHVTVLPESIISKVDVAVIGEGEYALSEIINNYPSKDLSGIPGIWYKSNGEIIKNPTKNRNKSIDFPFPARDLMDIKKYQSYWNYLDCVDLGIAGTSMIASRGCPYKCTYCQPTLNNIFGEKLIYRKKENVVDEIQYLYKSYGIEGIFFHDDTLTINKKWVLGFCQLLKKNANILWGCNSRINTIDEEMLQEMSAAGLRIIHFGIESGSQRILDDVYNKSINLKKVKKIIDMTKKYDIHSLGFFMIGAPTETEEEINMSIKLATSLKLNEVTFSITTPLIGTYLNDMVKESGSDVISDEFEDFDYYNKNTTVIKSNKRYYQRLSFLQKKGLFLFYLHPYRWDYILKHFKSINGMIKLYFKIKRFF